VRAVITLSLFSVLSYDTLCCFIADVWIYTAYSYKQDEKVWRVEDWLLYFLISMIDGAQWWALSPGRFIPLYALYRRLVGPQIRSRRCREYKNLCHLQQSYPRSNFLPECGIVIISGILSLICEVYKLWHSSRSPETWRIWGYHNDNKDFPRCCTREGTLKGILTLRYVGCDACVVYWHVMVRILLNLYLKKDNKFVYLWWSRR
jgi:hypothetical protein